MNADAAADAHLAELVDAAWQHTNADAAAANEHTHIESSRQQADLCRAEAEAASTRVAALSAHMELTKQLAALNDEQCKLLQLVIDCREASASKWSGPSKLHKKKRASCDRDAAEANEPAYRLESQVEELELKLEQLGLADHV